MHATKISLVTLAATGLSGCAGAITAWKSDPLQSYNVAAPSIYAMTGDRRTAVFTKRDSLLKYCAESLPDAVAAVAASSSATAKGKGVELGMTDATTISLLQTFQRTEIAEVSRQLGWNTCLAWSQGAITDAQYFGLLQQMVTGSIDVMKARASQPTGAPAVEKKEAAPADKGAPADKAAPAVPADKAKG